MLAGTRMNLQAVFKSTENYTNRTSVPNVHIAVHYIQDINLYGTAKNVLSAEGEQKHKVAKIHAPHTNGRETVLQLTKSVNSSQTMRFIFDGTFPDHPFTIQLNKVVTMCPMLRERFLGVSTSAEDPSTHKEPSNAVDSSGTPFELIRVGNHLKYIKQEHKEADIPHVIQAYHSEYGTSLSAGMKFQCLYWAKITARFNDDGHTRRVSLRVSSFVRRAESFYQIDKIITLRMGTQTRCFLICTPLIREASKEYCDAPYAVYKRADGAVCFGLKTIKAENLHFVEKSLGSWWWNPYIIYFT